MVPPCGICCLTAAKDKFVSRTYGHWLCALHGVVLVFGLYLVGGTPGGGCTAGVILASAATSSLAEPSAPTPAFASSAVEKAASDVQQETPSPVADNSSETHTFRPIVYDKCSIPLAVGGEIVRCDKDGGGRPHVEFSSFEGPQGPLLNQTFPMDIPPDFFMRRAMARGRDVVKQENDAGSDSGSSSSSTEGEKSGATSRVQRQEKGGSLDDPHFIRVFGRWTFYSQGLNLWLNRDAAPSIERRLTDKFAVAALQGQHNSTSTEPPQPPQRPSIFARMHTPRQPRLAHPVLYWRHTITSSPIEHFCIALIKLPVTEGGESDPAAGSAAGTIPGSCEDAQQLVSQRGSNASASDPFWLSCGPELQLSRLAKYLTFSISQEKVNRVLAALDYSVEIWEEPHGVEHSTVVSGQPSSDAKTAERGTANEQREVDAPTEQREASSFRGVEARRLSAKPDALVEGPPRWRVGVCLLNGHKGKGGEQEKMPTGDTRTRDAAAVNAATSVQSSGEREREAAAAKADTELQTELKEDGESKNETGEKQADNASSEAALVGELKFHLSPFVASQADDSPPGEPESIQIRHFIDAGWMYTRYIQGTHVSRFNRLAIKESRGGVTQPCVGFWDEHSLLSVAPDAYSWDEETQKGTLKFVWLRDGVDNTDALFDAAPAHHPTARMHICFYPNEEQPFGLFMGEVRFVVGEVLQWRPLFVADSADATLLVCFILFVFLALPLTCAVALSFHVYKHRHLRERLQRLVLVQQRDAVEQLLMRELGLSTEDQDDANDEDEDEEIHA
ncbi:hypothetical protein, conserved [Eimeria maxima]|uniref:Transmembrane protein n=1 Tax=Eimeria maxima TaxID=5804 RepID=U6M2W2_EIMMA|nr:hypothetical protein, conserved [Eimeria maxima]CDJ58537.1 hypothetical protein, conserved [Eimeria maxima]